MAKTALDLTREEWQAYHPNIAQVEGAAIKKRRRQAWRLAQKAAQILREKFGARKVVVFGSLAHDRWFTVWSDIDLAVWGIPHEQFYAAVAEVTGLSADFKVDIIDSETCLPAIREILVREGVEL